MPNWSSNALLVSGDSAQLAAFMERLHSAKNSDDRGIFNTFIPIDPKLLEDNDGSPFGEYRTPAWYEWRIQNWGTKWDVNYNEVHFVTDTHMTFDTAWSPPSAFVKTVSAQYPGLRFELAFSEMGMAFAGTEIFENGELIDETEVEVDWLDVESDDEDADSPPAPEWQAHMDKYRIRMGG